MSSEKKVAYLFLLLILFMTACVYKHLQDFYPNEKVEIQAIEEKPVENESTIETTKDNEIEKSIVDTTLLEKEQEDALPKVEANIDNKQQEELVNDNQAVQGEQVIEKIEEKREPLITTNEKYIRDGNEKRIEELSFETQELQLKINKFLKKHPIEFERGSYDFTDKSVKTIEEMYKYLKEYPNIKMEIAGHTDYAGEEKVNEYYSLQRAKSVEKKLLELGILADRLVVRGYGESIPLVEDGYAKINRRVEFNITEE